MRAGNPRWSRRMGVALVVGLALLATACGRSDMPQDALSPDGPIARMQDDLWQLTFGIAVVVFVLVQAAIVFAVIRFRAKGDETELPKQVHGNTLLEIGWTIVPALILAGIAFPTVSTIFALAEEPPEDERIDVTVVGKQYWWQFEYVEDGVLTANEMVIPVDTPVHVHLDGIGAYTGPDGEEVIDANADRFVIHSFWVPRLAGKVDYVPGHERSLTIQADEPGRYAGQCAEFCGLSHANMRFDVVAVTADEYDTWLEEQAQPAAEPEGELAQQGEELFEREACISCHQLDGHPASVDNVRTGPDLTHFGTREMFAGNSFEVDDTEQLKRWIANSAAEKPGSQMIPFTQLEEQELDALAAYLQGLE